MTTITCDRCGEAEDIDTSNQPHFRGETDVEFACRVLYFACDWAITDEHKYCPECKLQQVDN